MLHYCLVQLIYTKSLSANSIKQALFASFSAAVTNHEGVNSVKITRVKQQDEYCEVTLLMFYNLFCNQNGKLLVKDLD